MWKLRATETVLCLLCHITNDGCVVFDDAVESVFSGVNEDAVTQAVMLM